MLFTAVKDSGGSPQGASTPAPGTSTSQQQGQALTSSSTRSLAEPAAASCIVALLHQALRK